MLEEMSVRSKEDWTMAGRATYLVLFASSAHTGLSKTLRDSVAAHVVRVVLWHVVELALEQFAGSVFAFTLDLPDTWNPIDDGLQH